MKLKPEHKRKLIEGRKAKKERREGKTVKVDAHWHIRRFDDLNWVIEKDGKFFGYYGTLLDAFHSLPSKMLDEQAKRDLACVRHEQKAISETIETALKFKMA